jgi:hypothetical protein
MTALEAPLRRRSKSSGINIGAFRTQREDRQLNRMCQRRALMVPAHPGHRHIQLRGHGRKPTVSGSRDSTWPENMGVLQGCYTRGRDIAVDSRR